MLNESAFIAMVTVAVETFPDETLGVLIGLRKANKVMIQYARASVFLNSLSQLDRAGPCVPSDG
jgi:hypothetical protein